MWFPSRATAFVVFSFPLDAVQSSDTIARGGVSNLTFGQSAIDYSSCISLSTSWYRQSLRMLLKQSHAAGELDSCPVGTGRGTLH